MLSLRLTDLLFILLFAQGWCKSTKTFTGQDYNDEGPPVEYDEYDESDDGTVENHGPPKITSSSVNVQAPAGSTVLLPCNVTNADNLVVFWSKNNEIIKSEEKDLTNQPDRILVLANHTLKIINATVDDSSDNYNCSLSDRNLNPPSVVHRLFIYPSNNVSPTKITKINKDRLQNPASSDISVNYPKFYVRPGPEVTVEKGENVTIGCYSDLVPPPKMKWFHENKRIIEGSDKDQGSLTIFKITRHDAGFYQCLADNGREKPPHSAIKVIVKYSPEVEVEHETVHSGPGIESELTCNVYANPPARVVWSKNGRRIDSDPRHVVIEKNQSRHTLRILRTTDEDFAEYTCQATNEFGAGSKTITLTGAPSAPTIRGGELGSDDATILLKWHLQSHSPITEYKLEYRRMDEDSWKVLEPQVMDGTGNHYTVQHPIVGLEPGSYVAVLRARNSYGWSPPSDEHEFTGEYQPEGAESVKGSGVSSIDPTVISTTLLYVLSLWILKNL